MVEDDRPPEQDPDATQPGGFDPMRRPSLSDLRLTSLEGDASTPVPDFPADCRAGDMVGDYRLIRKISSGGFGTVFLAERVRPFVKEVALKVIRSDRNADPRWIARFDIERRLLAQLSHPNVAALLDGGNSTSGQMFLVMEFVDGEPINTFCDRRKLGLRDRLGIFLQLCDAMQHAHGKGVIHRDLSPRNVLVAEDRDGQPAVKVIDFGLAKGTGPNTTPRNGVTAEEYLPGTPGYASPEQFEPGAPHVDARSDVYSLGAILYELLAGVPPFDPQFLRERGWAAIYDFLREQAPRTPSDLLSTMATSDSETASRIALARKERLERLTGALKAELEWIPLQALRPEQSARYQTVQSLAQDVRNYLGGMPLLAAPESRAYRVRKFARRHGKVLAAVGVSFAALLATVVAVSLALAERGRALAQAREREAELAAVLEFQTQTLSGAQAVAESGSRLKAEIAAQADRRMRDLGVEPGDRERRMDALRRELEEVNVAELLRQSTRDAIVAPAVGLLDADIGLNDRVRALLLQSLGRSLLALGFEREARRPLGDAATINERLFGSGGEAALRSRLWLAATDPDPASGKRASDEIGAALAELHEADPRSARDALRLTRDLEALLPGGGTAAIDLAKQLADRSRTEAPGSREAIEDTLSLGELQAAELLRDDALATLERAASMVAATNAPPDLRARALLTLGSLLASGPDRPGRDRGVQLLRDADRLAAATWGLGHPNAIRCRGDLAACLVRDFGEDQGALDEAIRLMDLTIELEKRMGLDIQSTRADRSNLATALALRSLRGNDPTGVARAAVAADEAMQAARAASPEPTAESLRIQRSAAVVAALTGNFARAEQLLSGAMAEWARAGEPNGSVEMLTLAFELGRSQRALGKADEAIRQLAAAQDAAARERPEKSESRWFVSTLLLGLLEESGAAPQAIATQRAEVERLRAAANASRQHSCKDWRALPWPKAGIDPR